MNYRRPFVLLTLLALQPVFTTIARAQELASSSRDTPYVRDAGLVALTVRFINAQLAPAKYAIGHAAMIQAQTLITMAITGASDAEILAYHSTTLHRLADSALQLALAGRAAVEDALEELHRRHGSHSHGYTELLLGTAFMLESNIAVRYRYRWSQIDTLVLWLTR